MSDSSSNRIPGATCALCRRTLGSQRFARVVGATLRVYDSEACVRSATSEERRARWAARGRAAKRLAFGVIAAGAFFTPHERPPRAPPPRPQVAARTNESPTPALPPGWFGPEWPPTETSLLAALGRDAWVHPLAGPYRRMPRADTRVFGAVRPGNRAVECRNGHCGVDLGGEIWGEHVHAVHDGVVDYVQRGPNPDHGGSFVRISHHDGTVFSQYFHLAAIPRGIERGKIVKCGEVVGLLGDTGVKESMPHLHFAMSVRPVKPGYERYIDPEPLIALWPIRVPVGSTEVGLVSIVGQPGFPLGSALLKPGQKGKAAKAGKTKRTTASKHKSAEDAAPDDEATPVDDGPAFESDSQDPSTQE